MKVREAMHADVTLCDPDTPLREVARMMREQDIGSIPVGENDRLIGMVTDRDIATKGLGNGRDIDTMTARDVLSSPIIFCSADWDIGEAARHMEINKVRRLPVIDENRRMVGMLSLGDIASASGRELTGELVQAVAEHHG